MGCEGTDAINLLQAILLWFGCEQPISAREMWGLTIRRWGHVGKALTYISAAFVLAEIIGYERLTQIGAALASKYRPNLVVKKLRWLWLSISIILFLGATSCVYNADNYWADIVEKEERYLNYPAYFVMGAHYLIAGLLTLIGLPLFMYASFSALVGLAVALMGFLLKHPRLQTQTKVLAFALLTIGASLDMLAS